MMGTIMLATDLRGRQRAYTLRYVRRVYNLHATHADVTTCISDGPTYHHCVPKT